MLKDSITQILSDILIPIIALYGFFYIVFGKPKNKITKVYTRNNNFFFLKESNLTKKVLQIAFYLVLAFVILESI